MRSKPLGYAAVAGLVLALSAGPALAQAKGKRKDGDADKVLDKQMAWEQQVMGDDGEKKAGLKKIAAAQKMNDDARKNPEPLPAPKVKDPNKEGARAKQEASIGLAIESDKAPSQAKKAAPVKKAAEPPPSNSANDELGALVATSLAEEKATSDSKPKGNLFGDSPSSDSGASKGKRGVTAKATRKGKAAKAHRKARGGRTRAAAPPPSSSSLDRMFAAGN